ncbi:MAG: tetratricopeptide repeat protein [Pseudomonadota bacterium]
MFAFSLLMSACVQPGLHPPPLDSAEATQGSVVEISSKLSRAREALFEGRSVDARDTYVAAVRESSGDPRAILGLAEAHLALGETERAGQILASVNDRRSGINTARLKQARGIVALRLEQPEKARRLLEQSVDADASLWRAWMALGRARLIGNQPHAAQEAFLMAEQVAPRSASAHNDIGMAYLRLENADAAISHFERALQISPAHELAQANLRIVKAMKGDYSGAMVGVPASQRHHALNNVGYVALMNGEFSIADRYLRHAIELSPTHHQTAAANLELIPN